MTFTFAVLTNFPSWHRAMDCLLWAKYFGFLRSQISICAVCSGTWYVIVLISRTSHRQYSLSEWWSVLWSAQLCRTSSVVNRFSSSVSGQWSLWVWPMLLLRTITSSLFWGLLPEYLIRYIHLLLCFFYCILGFFVPKTVATCTKVSQHN